jgi:hypothetical protein
LDDRLVPMHADNNHSILIFIVKTNLRVRKERTIRPPPCSSSILGYINQDAVCWWRGAKVKTKKDESTSDTYLNFWPRRASRPRIQYRTVFALTRRLNDQIMLREHKCV